MPSVPPSAPSFARAARTSLRRLVVDRRPAASDARGAPSSPPERLGSARGPPSRRARPRASPRGLFGPPAAAPGSSPRLPVLLLLLLLLLLPLARADADARALASPTERTLLSAASASSSWVAPICASPEVNCDDPDQTPEWARDVEALQALRRDCDPDAGTFIGDRGWHSEPWDAIATFAGTKSEWTTLACSSDAPTSDVNCDGDGRVRRFAPKRLALRCASLPPEFAALTRLLELEIEGQYRLADWPTMDAFLAPAVDLAALETLRVKTSSVRGALPDLCGAGLLPHLRTLDIETPLETLGGEGLACLSNLETLRLAGLALRGAHALPDAWKSLTRLETLELRDVTAAPGVLDPADANAIGPLPNAWFEEISSSGEAISSGNVVQRGMRSLATLDAQESGLVGTIPRAIGEAPLQRLILRANDLVGTIPASFANLTALVEFDARENALAGEIPPDAFAGAAALREVRLSGNAFRGALPASLLGGPTKEALELVDVANQGHDGEGFEGPLPDFDAPNLLTFLAGENALAGPLPASLGSGAPNLETLDLSHNAIDGAFPDSMDRLASLKSVNVQKNQLTGGLENGWLGVSSDLAEINLSRNDFGSVPEVLCGPGTTTLDVSDNPRLVGGVGEALDACVELRELLLGMVWEGVEEGEKGEEENAEGSPGDPSSPSDDDPSSPAPLAPLAATFAGLVRLETVSLRGLGLTGTIPPALFALTTLKSLDLSDNRLAGEIPDASRLASLETLRLGGNRLEGLVPASLLTSTKLTSLNAPGNRLTGIEDVDASSDDGSPSFTSSSVVLSDALLSDNAFPAFPGALRRHAATLRVVDLANNRDMSGPVPPWVGAECVSLTHLNLRGCALSGPIGAWLGDAHELTRLRVLDLRGASEVERQDHRGPLTGAATVRAMNLTTLRLDHQRRFGANVLSALSVEGFALGRLETLTARGAGMTGALPSRLFGPDAAPRLETLDLRDNEIEGVVPSASGGDSDSSSGSSSSSSSGSSFSHPLRELRLANNSFDDLAPFPALPPEVVRSGAADFADATETATGFACPLPSAEPAYASVACTCAGGHFAPTVYYRPESQSQSEPQSESAPGPVEDVSGRFACEPCAPGTFVPEEVPAAADDDANDAANDALAALSAIFSESSSDLSSPLRTFPALRCAACANGTASPHPGATACSPCPPGAFSPVPARDRCDACAPGTFFASPGASGACASCPPGRIAPESGATACAPCDAGSSPNANGDACEPCAAGSFAAARGSETCAPCPEGQYVALEGAAKCALCPPGTSRGVEGGRSEAECVPCPGGTSTEGASGAARCVACEPGTFAEGILDEGGLLADAEDGAEVYGPSAEDGGPNASQSSPSQNHSPPPPAPPPPPSAAAAIVGASRCSPSPAGAFVADRGAVRATACAPGTFAPQAGMVACVACAAGRFAPEPGSTACLACPPGSESDEGADRCRCLPGHAPGAVSGGGLRCDPCAPGTFFASDALVGSASSSGTTPHPGGGCSPCAAGTFADKNASVRCDAFSPGAAGADFIHPETRTGARAQVHCAPGTVARQELIPGTLHVAVGCVECPDGTVASAVGSLRCEACARGSVANDERTACVFGVSEDTAAGPLGVFAGLGDDSNGRESGAQYNDTLAARVASAANSGRFAGTRGATAFFILLGLVTLVAGAFLRWRRLRRERLRELALEREVLLEEAEAEMCERGAVRRKTLYALAGVDAEAAEVETSAVLDLGDEKRFISMAAADEAAAASNTHRTRSRAATGARRGKKVPKVPWFLGWLFPRRGRGRDRASDSSLFESSDDDDDGRLDSISPESARARAAGAVRRRKTRAYSRAAGAFPKEGKKYYRTTPSDASTAPEDDPYALADAFLGVVPDRRSRAVSSARRGAELAARRISARSRVRAASRAMAHEREEEEEGQEEQTREEDDARGVMSGGGVVSEEAGPESTFPRKKKNIAAADSRRRGPPRGTAGADGSSGGSRGGRRRGDPRGVVPKRSEAASEAFDRRSGGEEEDAAPSDDAPSDAEGRRVEAVVLRAMRRASAAGMIPGWGDPARGEPGGGVRGGGEVALLPPVPERD